VLCPCTWPNSFGAGYEFWVGGQWSVGPIVRVTYQSLGVKGKDSDAESKLSLFTPSVLFGATYH